MACIDVQVRNLPSGRGGRILVWLVTPRQPPLVLDPYPEQYRTVNGVYTGWWALHQLYSEFWWYRNDRPN